MRAELANLNDCAVPFLSRAAVNLSWYDIISIYISTFACFHKHPFYVFKTFIRKFYE